MKNIWGKYEFQCFPNLMNGLKPGFEKMNIVVAVFNLGALSNLQVRLYSHYGPILRIMAGLALLSSRKKHPAQLG